MVIFARFQSTLAALFRTRPCLLENQRAHVTHPEPDRDLPPDFIFSLMRAQPPSWRAVKGALRRHVAPTVAGVAQLS